MDDKRIEELKNISAEVRKDVLRMVGMARSGPYETPLAIASLLVYLYWEELALIPSEPRREADFLSANICGTTGVSARCCRRCRISGAYRGSTPRA